MAAKNYKNKILCEVVQEALSSSAIASEQVVAVYKEKSGEKDLHDNEDIKWHWSEKLCDKFNKPNGNPCMGNDFTLQCQHVHLLIVKKYLPDQ